ncbi:MAG: hypothetical protein KAX39_02745 [candidate division Zixibacteria bacterium]|nr:hypothetical protein [candidate division Zixibacteria bacterium]
MHFFTGLLRIVVLLALLGLLIYGVKLGGVEETRYNGSILCLSCIGIE